MMNNYAPSVFVAVHLNEDKLTELEERLEE
jgi:hypothetical protein